MKITYSYLGQSYEIVVTAAATREMAQFLHSLVSETCVVAGTCKERAENAENTLTMLRQEAGTILGKYGKEMVR